MINYVDGPVGPRGASMIRHVLTNAQANIGSSEHTANALRDLRVAFALLSTTKPIHTPKQFCLVCVISVNCKKRRSFDSTETTRSTSEKVTPKQNAEKRFKLVFRINLAVTPVSLSTSGLPV